MHHKSQLKLVNQGARVCNVLTRFHIFPSKAICPSNPSSGLGLVLTSLQGPQLLDLVTMPSKESEHNGKHLSPHFPFFLLAEDSSLYRLELAMLPCPLYDSFDMRQQTHRNDTSTGQQSKSARQPKKSFCFPSLQNHHGPNVGEDGVFHTALGFQMSSFSGKHSISHKV